MNEVIAILGDIHSNLEAFQAVLAKCHELGVTHYVCLGDIVGYNANPHECLEMTRSLNPLAVVRGNHDEYIGMDRDLAGFNPMASAAVKWTRQQLSGEERAWLAGLPYTQQVRLPGTGMVPFQIVHATLDTPCTWGYVFNRFTAIASMEYQGIHQLCFCGHTHIPMLFVKTLDDTTVNAWPENDAVHIRPNTQYLFNIGSIGQPRDGDSRAAFAIYIPSQNTVQLHRLKYDIGRAQEKIIAADLPEMLAERLAEGK